MSTTPVTRDQFEVISDQEVQHRGTGAAFSTHRYAEPPDALDIRMRHSGQEIDAEGNEYDLQEVAAMAEMLLREMAARSR
jgi:hypothetical protein